ncbi:MAG: response regulator transcription factor [Elusimicrobia bacterium]|nr:response regulator transcription factor [Elusimicrobiota bacterium]
MKNKHIDKLLLVDDHRLMRESLITYVEDHCKGQLTVVAQAGDGVAAIEAVRKHRPTVALVDIGLPLMDGITAIREMKKIHPSLIVVVFSTFEDQAHVVSAIRAGADDYIFKKDASAAQVVGNILRAVGGSAPAPNTLQNRLFTAIRGAEPDQLVGITPLTGAELEVLKLAANHGYSMKEIAQSLGGKQRSLSENTIRKHLTHIYEKLGARNQAHAIALAIKTGIITAQDASPADSSSL